MVYNRHQQVLDTVAKWSNEPQLEKTYIRTCAFSEYSDQPARSRSLISILTERIWDRQRCKFCFILWTMETLVRLHGCAGWVESSSVAHIRRHLFSRRCSDGLLIQQKKKKKKKKKKKSRRYLSDCTPEENLLFHIDLIWFTRFVFFLFCDVSLIESGSQSLCIFHIFWT